MDPMQLVVCLVAIAAVGLWIEGRSYYRRRKEEQRQKEMLREARKWWGQR